MREFLGMRRCRAVLLAALMLTGWLGIPAFETGAKAEDGKALTSVRFAVIPLLTATPVYVGINEGYFKAENIDLKLTKIEGGAPIIQAMMAGSLDAAEAGSVPMMIATSRGVKLVNVCTFLLNKKGKVTGGIYVLKDSGIKTLADLKGKKIGVHTIGSFEDIIVRTRVLPSLNLTASDVRIVEIPFSVMETALLRGHVDAVVPFQPFTAALMNNPKVATLSDLTHLLPPGGIPVDTYVFPAETYEKSPHLVSGFDRAIKKSIQFINRNPEQAAKIATKYLKFPEALSQQAIKQMTFNEDCSHDRAGYEALASGMKKVGSLSESYDPGPYLK